ncbi:MAG: hypothetical protein M3Y09_14555 [Actinomycetota bacterium]|nr:hypothetical protein [Actinomycetota bacterium]
MVPAVVAGRTIEDRPLSDGCDPGDPGEVAYRWVQADESLVDEAVAAAAGAGARWRDRSLEDRRRLIGVMARDWWQDGGRGRP